MSPTTPATPLTVVLVHGAFADASGWNGVVQRLQADGVPVIAPSNPLRGIAHDSAYTKSSSTMRSQPTSPSARPR